MVSISYTRSAPVSDDRDAVPALPEHPSAPEVRVGISFLDQVIAAMDDGDVETAHELLLTARYARSEHVS